MIIVLLAVVIGVLILYTWNLNLKPLNFPKGPLTLPLIGSLYALGKEPHKKLIPLKKKYGSVFRIDFGGFRGIVLADHRAIKDAFALQAFTDRPMLEIVTHFRGQDYNSGLIWARGKIYEEQRRFVIKNLKSFGFGKSSMEGEILKHLENFFIDFDKKIGGPIQNKHIFNTLAVKSIWNIVTGVIAKDDDPEFGNAVEAVNEAAEAGSSAGAAFFFPGICKLFPRVSGWTAVINGFSKIKNFAKAAIEAHKNSSYSGEPRDFIDVYLQKIRTTTDQQSSFYGNNADGHLQAVVEDLFLVGTESVSTSLAWLLLILVLHPEVQDKIQAEIDNVIGKNRLPSLDDRQKLIYTECCILELLRYSAFIPMAAPHVASDDVNFYGYFIPKGTIVVPSIYGVLHDPDSWDDPDSFLPERFLTDDGCSIDRNKSNLCSFIFGSGKRGCLGENLARDELFLFTIGLCQRYTFSEDPREKPTLETTLGATLVPKPHSMLVFRR